MYGLCLIPLVSYGLDLIINAIKCALTKMGIGTKEIRLDSLIQVLTIALFCVICFGHNPFILLLNKNAGSFDFLTSTINYQYTLTSPTASLTIGDSEFLKNVEAITGTHNLVINDPNDGSIYAYGLDNINTYYRRFFVPINNDTSDLIRTRLADISFDGQVKDAVKSINAKYVLVLD